MALPSRPTPKPLQARVVRLRTALVERRRLKKDYAAARGKHLLAVLRESARSDLAALEVSAFETLEAAGVDLGKRADDLEAANSDAQSNPSHEGGDDLDTGDL
jgi:hypothetical protein